MNSPYCPKCETTRSGLFCSICGLQLVEAVRSCVCGYANIWPYENFCEKCGTPASSVSQNAVPQFMQGAERTEASTGKTGASNSEEKR